jgi:hypothetical protein
MKWAYEKRSLKHASITVVKFAHKEEGWFEASCGDGSKGARIYDWLTLGINQFVSESL